MADRYKELQYQKSAFIVEKWQEDVDLFEVVREFLFAWLGINCLMGWIREILGLTYNPLTLLLGSLFLVLVLEGVFLFTSQDIHKWISIGIGAFSLLFFFLPFAWNGLQALCHDASKTLAGRGILLFIKGQENDSAFDRICAVILLACLFYLLMRLCSAHFMGVIPWVLAGMLWLEIRCGNGESRLWLLAFFLWMILKLVTTMRAYLFILFPVCAITVLFAILSGVEGTDGWRESFESFRYGNADAILPSGDLTKARKMQRGQETMLTLQGEGSGYFYLKGFVGTVYEESRWLPENETLDDFEAGILAGNNEFLDWLHGKGYSGWNELSDKFKESQETEEDYVTIHNVNANRSFLYLPYELTTKIRQIEEEKKGVSASGEAIHATGIFGQKDYHFKMISSLAGKEISAVSKNDGENDEYDAYEEYVYRTCLTLPKELKEYLRTLMEGNSTLGKGDTMATVAKVRSWLSKHVKYNESPDPLPEKVEFGRWFFEQNPEGYDVHYASAAVMLFRYYGIPARYVEGYLVEDTGQITAQAAHAWPEIFLSGRGWVPVEVMDSYRGRMPSYLAEKGEKIISSDPEYDEKESEDISQNQEQETEQNMDSTHNSQNSEEISEEGAQEKESGGNDGQDKKDGKKGNRFGIGKGSHLLGNIPVFLIGILLIIILIYLFFRIREYRTRRWATQSSSPERCVEMWYRYCIWLIYLLEKDPLIKQDMEKDNRLIRWERRWVEQHPEVSKHRLREAELLRQKAIYRKKGIEWEEAGGAIAFFETEYRCFYKELKAFDRIRVHLGLRPAFLQRIFRQ